MGALSAKEKSILKSSGFLPNEIEAFDTAKTPDGEKQKLAFDSAPFMSMIMSRVKWITDLKERGWSNSQIINQIRRYYHMKSGRSPFDFLKLEYKPPKKIDFIEASKTRTRVKTRVSNTFGKGYGGRMTKKKMPRFLPIIRTKSIR